MDHPAHEIYESAWNRICERHELQTGRFLIKDLKDEPQTAIELLSRLEERKGKFDAFRLARKAKYSRPKEVVSIIERLCIPAGTAATWMVPPGRPTVALIGHMLKAFGELSLQYDIIQQLLTDVVKTIELGLELDIDAVKVDQQEIFERNLADVFASAIEVLAYIVTEAVRSRLRSFWSFLLKGQDPEFANLKTKLEQAFKFALFAYSNFKSTPKFQEVTTRNESENTFHDPLSEMDRMMVPETGSWLHQELDFGEWMHRRTTFLWVHGSSGFGKTYLAASVILYLRSPIRTKPGGTSNKTTFVAYAFFSKTNTPNSKDILYDALEAMVEQLSQANTHYSRFAKKKRPLCAPRKIEILWEKLFVDYFSGPGRELFLILDGVDEIHESDKTAADKLFHLLLDLRNESRLCEVNSEPSSGSTVQIPSIKVALFGRPQINGYIERLSRRCSLKSIEVQEVNSAVDLHEYIDERLRQGFFQLRPH